MKGHSLGQEKGSQILVKYVKGVFLIPSNSALLVVRYTKLTINFSIILHLIVIEKNSLHTFQCNGTAHWSIN